MRITLTLLIAALALLAVACDGDDDGDATPTSPAATATSAPASPTPAASTPTPGADAAITIDAPANGATVNVPFTVSGTANVYEAVLFVQVIAGGEGTIRGQNLVLCEHRVMATSGTGTPGTWETTVALSFTGLTVDATGTRGAAIRAFSRSPRDGAEENVVTRNISLSNAAPNITIDTPACNASFAAGSTLAASGRARVFEATLLLELRDPAGAVVASQMVLAAEAGPAFAPWSASLSLAGVAAGSYELVAYNTSARDGTVENEFAIPVVVTP